MIDDKQAEADSYMDRKASTTAALLYASRAMRGEIALPEPEPLVDLPGGIIDWPAEMRECVAQASQMNDTLYANATGDNPNEPGPHFAQVHDILARLVNVTAWLVDENARNETALSAARRREDMRMRREVPL